MAESFYITQRKAQNIYNAFDYAEFKGERLSHFIVINLDVDPEQNDHCQFRKIRDSYADWRRNWIRKLRPKNVPSFGGRYVFTLENPSGDNLHVNWVLYIPDLLRWDFNNKLENWVRDVVRNYGRHTIESRLINPDAYKSTANYILKGVHPDDANNFYIQHLCAPQGSIHGQRAGFSNSLGPRAIADDNFNPTAYRRQRRNRYRKAA